jgi:DNA repair protein RecN (Recombination protein N)
MLLELEIENFALIRRLQLTFAEGLNAFTGETGAGKSIVLDALGFLLGNTVREARNGERSRVAGRFLLTPEARTWLIEQGFEEEEEALVVREVSAAGRSSCRINASLCTIGQLKMLGERLVEIHGQHQSVALQRPSRHLELVDRIAGDEHLARLAQYRQTHRRVQSLQAKLEELQSAERERNREIEWLRFEVQEIGQAELKVNEEEELNTQVKRLSSVEEISSRLGGALNGLLGEGGTLDGVTQAQRQLGPLLRLDSELEPLLERLTEAGILLEDTVRELQSYSDGLQSDPNLLDVLQTRQELLKTLRRKYGQDVEAILAYQHKAELRLQGLEGAEQQVAGIQTELVQLQAERERLAGKLSESRASAGRDLEIRVTRELAELNLTAMRFSVHQESANSGAQGADYLEFYLAANPGSPAKPLAKVASGGELSRIMLALISMFASFDPVPTLVFDEIDAGLGGRAAEAVARKLNQLARTRQVLCVTHLAVIAAAGHHHLRVVKDSDQQTTSLNVQTLDPEEREREVARMLSGDASPEVALRHARELIRRGVSP